MNERDLPGKQPQPDPPRDESGYRLHRHIARPFDPVLKRLRGEAEPAPVLPPDPETPEGQAQIQAWRKNPPPRYQPVTERSLGVYGEAEGDPYEIFEVPPEFELGAGERFLDAEPKSDLFIGIQTGPSYPVVDLHGLQGAGGAPAFDILMPIGGELPDDLQHTLRELLAIHAERLVDEGRQQRGDSGETEIVDVAKLEAEQRERRERKRARDRERRRQWYHELKQAALRGDEGAIKRWERLKEQNRQAHRRWRRNHPEQVRDENRRYYQRRWARPKRGHLP
jgi:hypothetical protein